MIDWEGFGVACSNIVPGWCDATFDVDVNRNVLNACVYTCN